MTVLSDFVLLEILDAFCVGNTIPWVNSVGEKLLWSSKDAHIYIPSLNFLM